MDGKKIYSIQINGITESVNAVESLNKQLVTLEQRINVVQTKSVKAASAGNSGGGSKNQLSEEEKLLKQIESTEAKIEAYSKNTYQNYLAAKDVLKETLNDQKQIAAQERLQANSYSNTMAGMKERLADIKQVMQTTDVGSDMFKTYTKEANELTQKLKEIEESYGQFGRNVGNYASAAEGFNKIKVAVGDTVREYDNYRKAMKELKQEQMQLSQTLGKESKEYKNVHNAIKQLESDYKDLSKSSAFMDNVLDSMQTLTSIASIGAGISGLFGIDDAKFNETMQRLASLYMVLKGIETLKQQWDANDSWLMRPFKKLAEAIPSIEDIAIKASNTFGKAFQKGLSAFFKTKFKIIGSDRALDEMMKNFPGANMQNVKTAWNGMTKEMQMMGYEATKTMNIINNYGKWITTGFNFAAKAVKYFGRAIRALAGGIAMLAIPEIIEFFTDFVKSLNTTKLKAEQAAREVNALTRALEARKDALGASYLKGEINDEEYLKKIYDAQTESLIKQIDVLKTRGEALKNEFNGFGDIFSSNILNLFSATQNTEFSGKKFTSPTTVGHGRATTWFFQSGNDLNVTVKNINEVEEAWRKCNEAVKEGKDWFDKYDTEGGDWIDNTIGWWNSLWATVKDTEEVMRGMGNIKLSDFVARFGEVNEQFKSGKMSAEQYAAELKKLKKEMNDNEVLNSVIANLDQYIPDDKVREAVQNIINEIIRLDDAFNMTSEAQIHYWNQVRIDAMKDGAKKTMEQIKENERHEIVEQGKTQEQINLIHKKYQRQRLDAQEKYNKEAAEKAKEAGRKRAEVENQLIALRIENMKNGLKKQLAEIENQRRLELQKAKDNGIKVGELTLEINKKYDQKILEEKRRWAYETLKIYEDLARNIQQFNSGTFSKEVSTASQNTQIKANASQQSAASSMITPSTYGDTNALEEYYKKVVEIRKNAADREMKVEQEKLDKELEYAKQEEELRHNRLINTDGGEYIQQLRAGLISQEQYNKLIEDENDAHYARMNALDREYASNSSAITQSNLETQQKLYNDYYNNIIGDLRKDKDKTDEIMSKQPVTDKTGWGVVNIGKTKENYKTALSQYDALKAKIVEKQKELDADLKAGRINPEDFAMRRSDLDNEIKTIDQAVKDVEENQRNLIGVFIASISQYIQVGLQGVQDLMSTIWDAQDAAYEKEMEDLEKQIDAQEELYNKQKELAEEHRSTIDNIEEELSTARGDRRQRLIDQLNSEMAAQRKAIQEQKKAEKEQEKLQKKKEKEEEQQRKREHKRQIISAIISAALATVNGLATQPFMPLGIAMGALAAALGAAQVAIISSQKYASGGVIEGKSHAQGGVKVLGGRAEVEGGEYITNKATTEKNVDLLEYINSKRKKIDLSDMIDFYKGGSVKRNISGIKTKFADGGSLPTLRGDINISDRLVNAMEDYSKRPVQVAVVDIIDRAQAVNDVKVMAGLE